MTLDTPRWETLNVAALVLTLAAGVLVFRFKLPVLQVLGICAAAGIVLRIAGAV